MKSRRLCYAFGLLVALGCGDERRNNEETNAQIQDDASAPKVAGDAGREPPRKSSEVDEPEEPVGADAGEPEAVRPDTPRTEQPCELDTGWVGDEACILAPDPLDGMQFHFGPSNYDDADEVDKYVLQPGEERLLCGYLIAPNDEEIYYANWFNSLRPGSHHMIVTMATDITEGSPLPCGEAGFSDQGLVGGNSTSVAPFAQIAPENEGLARKIPAHSGIVMQMHFFNLGDEPLLMEAWQNIYFMPADEVRGLSSPIEGIAGLMMSVEPGATEVIAGAMVAPADLRIVDLFAHHHSHTKRFTAFVHRPGDDFRTLVYESYDWADPLYLPLDSIHENSPPDSERKVAGGWSGPLRLNAGDLLEWECEIENHDLDIALRFANEATTAEMCIMRGDYAESTGAAWSAYLP